ncbi:hypothetical protein GGR51DRAFT_534587 [Nemania sp. FL0031]|nr:hypothetical protein GGR51DRAFT_534587 [Nemania sp. FL0031]
MSSTVSDSGSGSGSDSDSDSYIDRANIIPTIFTSDSCLEILAEPAIMTWHTSDGKERCLSQLNLDLYYDVSNSRAFLKLRAAIAFKFLPRSTFTAPVWLFIHPERIRALALNASPRTKVASTLGPETVCLHFELSRLAALVVPREPLATRNPISGSLLDSLREAVQQSSFSVYAKVERRNSQRQRLLELCSAVSRNELKSTLAHSVTTSLYGGTGGDTIEGDSLLHPNCMAASGGQVSAIEPLVGKPPSYKEVPPGPPPAAVPFPHKRRRLSSPGPRPTLERSDKKYIEQICADMLGNKLGQLSNKLDRLTRDVAKQFEGLEERVKEYVDEQLTQHCSGKIEDECYGLKVELEDYIGDEMKEAEGRIMDQLGSASFSIHLDT